ncbi:MAG TPA: lyase family protein, partial [Gaiella sp.]
MTAFDALFVPDDLREAVSGRSWLEAMLEAERALATAGALAGIVPEGAAATIAEECSADAYDWDVLLLEWRRSGSPADALVRTLVRRAGEDAGRWVHLGATSQDIVDTAAMLVARQALGLVVDRLTLAADACAELARAHRDTPMAGRTLLQHAVPTTFGLKAAGWLVALADARGRLAELRETLPAQLGGAAGTLSGLGEHGIEVSALFARELALAEPTLPWHSNRTPVVELGAAL